MLLIFFFFFLLNDRDCDRPLEHRPEKHFSLSTDAFLPSLPFYCHNLMPVGFHCRCSTGIVLSKAASGLFVPKLNSCFKKGNILFLLDFPLIFVSFAHPLATLPPYLVYYNILIVLQLLQQFHFIFFGVL